MHVPLTDIWVFSIDSITCIGWGAPYGHERKPIPKEPTDINPYTMFANASCLTEMMLSLERYMDPLLPGLVTSSSDSKYSADVDKRTVAKLFKANPTRTDIAKTGDAITAYRYEDMCENDRRFIQFLPLQTCIEASRDLRAVCRMFAYSLDECDRSSVTETLEYLPTFCTNREMKTHRMGVVSAPAPYVAPFENESDLQRYYNHLCESPSNELSQFVFTHPLIIFIADYDDETLKKECSNFVYDAFNVIISETTYRFVQTIEDGRLNYRFIMRSEYALSAIWEHFAEQFADGKASICDRCGNIYFRQRKTRQYCSQSCAQLASDERRRSKTARDDADATHDRHGKGRCLCLYDAMRIPAHANEGGERT